MDYSSITEEELNKRFESLPNKLKELLDDEQSLPTVSRVCQNHHLLDEERVLMVQQLAALVIFGLIHAEDLAQEIDAELALNNYKLSKSIAEEIDSKIFAPVKSELNKNYRPLETQTELGVKLEIDREAVGLGAKPQPVKPAPLDLRELERDKAAARPLEPPSIPTPSLIKTSPTPLPPKPMTEMGPSLSDLGTSRFTAREVAPLRPPPFTPRTPAIGAEPPVKEILPKIQPRAPQPQPFGVIEQIKNLEKSGAELVEVLKKKGQAGTGEIPPKPLPEMPPPKPAPGTPPVTKPPEFKGPVIIHQESEPEPIKPSGFHLEFPTPRLGGETSKKPEMPPGLARLEIKGLVEKPAPGAPARTEVIKPPKVIHYSALQTPLETPPRPTQAIPSTPTGTQPEKLAPTKLPGPPPLVTPKFPPPLPAGPSSPPKVFGGAGIKSVDYGTETPGRAGVRPEKLASESTGGRWFKSLFGFGKKEMVNPVRGKALETPSPIPLGASNGVKKSIISSSPNIVPPPPPAQPRTAPPIQKTADIKPTNLSSPSGTLSQGEEMIDLGSLTKIKDEK